MHWLQQSDDLTADKQNKNERFIFCVYRTFGAYTKKNNNNNITIARRSQSGSEKQKIKRNNEKYCSFAQTLESDEPIKLVAQIKTNYNVWTPDDEIGPVIYSLTKIDSEMNIWIQYLVCAIHVVCRRFIALKL